MVVICCGLCGDSSGDGQGGAGGSNNQRFMSLEEECNWILSGREPVMQDGEDYSDDGDEDNTLDDISGDEVCTLPGMYIHFPYESVSPPSRV